MSLQGTKTADSPGSTGRADAATKYGRPGERPLRVLLHDFAGHPFQADLSRSLARRGHQILHVYCKSYTSGKGRFVSDESQPNLSFRGVPVGQEFARYAPLRRAPQELLYGRRFARLAAQFEPDVVLVCNVPLLAQWASAHWLGRNQLPWVFWLQDLYSVAVRTTAEDRAGTAGRLLGHGFERLERALLQRASHVVSITDDFAPMLEQWGISPNNHSVIENWAPLVELPERPRDSSWRREQGLGERFVFLYTGTLGLKHRPELLYELAAQRVEDADVVVISQGLGEARLRELLHRRPLPNLKLLPFQPFEQYPDILGSADVLVALLEPSAGTFSVPSKVLSYLCAGRPILGAIPTENLAARTIERAGAGLVVPPTDQEAFLLAAKRLRNESWLRAGAGSRARAYAETTFDTDAITDRFLEIIHQVSGRERVMVLP